VTFFPAVSSYTHPKANKDGSIGPDWAWSEEQLDQDGARQGLVPHRARAMRQNAL